MSVSPHAVLHRRPEVSARELSDGGVLVNMRSGECFELNRVGYQIWNAIDGRRGIDQICDSLALVYPVGRSQLTSDLRSLIEGLLRAGLLEYRAER
jgi:hypothetical protein